MTTAPTTQVGRDLYGRATNITMVEVDHTANEVRVYTRGQEVLWTSELTYVCSGHLSYGYAIHLGDGDAIAMQLDQVAAMVRRTADLACNTDTRLPGSQLPMSPLGRAEVIIAAIDDTGLAGEACERLAVLRRAMDDFMGCLRKGKGGAS